MTGKKHILHSIHHFLTGAVLIIKGIDKINHHVVPGGLILLFGIIILSYFIYGLFQNKHSNHFELMVRWFEAIVSLFMAYIFFSEGKMAIQYVFLLAAIGFFVSIYVFNKKAKKLTDK